MVTTEQAASGTSSLQCKSDGQSGTRAALALTFEGTPTIRVRMSVRFGALPANWLTFLQTMHVTEEETRRLAAADLYSSSQIDVWNYPTQSSDFHQQAIALDTWYRIDFTARMSSTDGSVSLLLDGSDDRAELSPINTSDFPINQLLIGITLVANPIESLTLYIDDIEISEQ